MGLKAAILKRLYKIKERLYIEARYLEDFGFSIGQPIQFEIDQAGKTITVTPGFWESSCGKDDTEDRQDSTRY